MSPDDPFKRVFPDETYVPPAEADLRKQALQRAYEIARSITTEQEKAAEPAPRIDRGPLLRTVNAALAATVALWLFLAPPAWLPQGAPDHRTPEQRELGLRTLLAMEAARVTAYRDAQGRLPESLADAGGDQRAVQYTPIDRTHFTLSAHDGTTSITYDSADFAVGGSANHNGFNHHNL